MIHDTPNAKHCSASRCRTQPHVKVQLPSQMPIHASEIALAVFHRIMT
jgi:hypothetical protein